MFVKLNSLSILAVVLTVGVLLNPIDANAQDRDGRHENQTKSVHHSYVQRDRYSDFDHSGIRFTFPHGFVSWGYSRPQPSYTIVQTAPVVYESAPVLVSSASYAVPVTVNIPNRWGGYTPVLIVPSGTGYIGPQGEYYYSFPSVEQLGIMYAK